MIQRAPETSLVDNPSTGRMEGPPVPLEHATVHPRIHRVCAEDLRAGRASAQAQLAVDVAARGYAILRLPATEAKLLEAAATAAAAFFKLPPTIKEATRHLFDEALVDAKGLVGYNMVTPAKAVYRIRRHSTLIQRAEHSVSTRSQCNKRQCVSSVADDAVWPPDHDLPRFRRDIEAAWTLLEELQHLCSAAVLGEGHHRRWESKHGQMLHGQKWSASPLDLFLYPNDEWAAGTVNCTEHKDPGLLSLIPCSTVPGLQVRAHGSEISNEHPSWVAVEALPGALPYQDVVVFPGVEMETLTKGRLRATLHGVAKAAVPRISIVYERRAEVSSVVSMESSE